MKTLIFPIILSMIVFFSTAIWLLLPARQGGETHILPGNGWTHDASALMQWTNNGTFGASSNWIRTEYGRRNAWLVHDKAVGGSRTFTRVAEFTLFVNLFYSAVSGFVTFTLACLLNAWRRSLNRATEANGE